VHPRLRLTLVRHWAVLTRSGMLLGSVPLRNGSEFMRFAIVLFAILGLVSPAAAEDFAEIAARAKGQTVYFNAWGGSRQINDYIGWAASELKQRYGVELIHVKLTDTGEAVARVAAEKAAGRTQGGMVDLIWINGENFKAMRDEDLLQGPITQLLPSFALV